MAEIAVLRTHIVNYAKTREVYVAYRKAGYSKKFREEHEEEFLRVTRFAVCYINLTGLGIIYDVSTQMCIRDRVSTMDALFSISPIVVVTTEVKFPKL